MPRRPRRLPWTEEACYHLLDRGHNRETRFREDHDRLAFVGLVRRYQQRFGFRLYHGCLLSNHFHLLVQRSDPQHLSPLMAGLPRAYVHSFHRRYGFWGHLFQGRSQILANQCERHPLSCCPEQAASWACWLTSPCRPKRAAKALPRHVRSDSLLKGVTFRAKGS